MDSRQLPLAAELIRLGAGRVRGCMGHDEGEAILGCIEMMVCEWLLHAW